MTSGVPSSIRYLLLPVAILLMFSSCVSLKKVKYIQDMAAYQQGDSVFMKNEVSPDYRVKPGDNLYIDIKTLDAKNMNPFEGNQNMSYQNNSEMSVYLSSYLVSDSGYISMPVVGKIRVVGKSISEIKDDLRILVSDFFQMATVKVKLVNFKVSFLGEVSKPGTYFVYQERISIFQAISLAGDLSPYANRSRVRIIREKDNGSSVITVNLLKAGIMESPAYYLQPDDIIYVEPMKSKNYAFTAFPYALIFSTITTTLLILNFFK